MRRKIAALLALAMLGMTPCVMAAEVTMEDTGITPYRGAGCYHGCPDISA